LKTKQAKREEAETRRKRYEKLSAKEKAEKLDGNVGKGAGAVKERAKLEKEISDEGNLLALARSKDSK